MKILRFSGLSVQIIKMSSKWGVPKSIFFEKLEEEVSKRGGHFSAHSCAVDRSLYRPLYRLLLKIFSFSTCNYADQIKPLVQRTPTGRLSTVACFKTLELQTLLLLFKYANHKNKRSFVSTANEALVGTLMTSTISFL